MPLAAQSRDEPLPYSRPAMTMQRHALVGVAHRRVVDEHLVARRLVGRVRPFLVGQRVAQPDVAEGAAHHHLVVAAPRAVAVELERRDAVLLQPLAGRAPGRDRAGRGDVVGGDRVAEHRQRARADDVVDRRRLLADAVEERRPRDVGRRLVPAVAVCCRPARAGRASARRRRRPRRRCARKMSGETEPCDRSRLTSSGVGQMSARKTGWPSLSVPSGSDSRSISTVPASANATTSGGEAR